MVSHPTLQCVETVREVFCQDGGTQSGKKKRLHGTAMWFVYGTRTLDLFDTGMLGYTGFFD